MFRRLLQFRLRSLLLMTLLIAISLAWYLRELQLYAAEQAAIERLKKTVQVGPAEGPYGWGDFVVCREWEPPSCFTGIDAVICYQSQAPKFLQPWLNAFHLSTFDRVEEVYLQSDRYDDESLAALAAFRSLKRLEVDSDSVTATAMDRFCTLHPMVQVNDNFGHEFENYGFEYDNGNAAPQAVFISEPTIPFVDASLLEQHDPLGASNLLGPGGPIATGDPLVRDPFLDDDPFQELNDRRP